MAEHIDNLRALLVDLDQAGVTLERHGDRLRVRPRDLAPDLLERIREHKRHLLDLLAKGDVLLVQRDIDRPPFPSPADWTSGRNITPEAVGMERYQRGGRPHALRRDLRKRWLTAYTEAMQVMSEPEAWAEAWREINP